MYLNFPATSRAQIMYTCVGVAPCQSFLEGVWMHSEDKAAMTAYKGRTPGTFTTTRLVQHQLDMGMSQSSSDPVGRTFH